MVVYIGCVGIVYCFWDLISLIILFYVLYVKELIYVYICVEIYCNIVIDVVGGGG